VGRYIAVRMPDQAKLVGPVQPGQVQLLTCTELMDVHSDTDPRYQIRPGIQISQSTSARRSVGQDLVEQSLGLVLVGLLGQGELAHENLPGLGQHALLTG
jgi:hypothetical protein